MGRFLRRKTWHLLIVGDDGVSLFRINGLFFSALFAGTAKISPSYLRWCCWIKFCGTWAWGYWDCATPENRCKSLWNSATLNVPKLEVMGSTPTARCFKSPQIFTLAGFLSFLLFSLKTARQIEKSCVSPSNLYYCARKRIMPPFKQCHTFRGRSVF